jgi:hypothetical protein
VQCEICKDKSHPTRDCPERINLIDKNEEENELFKFIREVDDFKKHSQVSVLEREITPHDIRNCILFTGKINEIDKEKSKAINHTDKIDNQEYMNIERNEKKERVNEEEKKIFNEPQNNIPLNPSVNVVPNNYNFIDQGVLQNTIHNNIMNQGLNYKVPINPIVDNPNVIRAPAINYYSNPNSFYMQGYPGINQNNYYGMGTQFNQNNMGFSSMPGNNFSYNRGLNLISSNFQGKIPMSYGVNQNMNMNMMNYPKPALNNYSAMNLNYRMNVGGVQMPIMNSNVARPVQNMNINKMNQSYIQPPEPEEPQIDNKNKSDDIQIDKII